MAAVKLDSSPAMQLSVWSLAAALVLVLCPTSDAAAAAPSPADFSWSECGNRGPDVRFHSVSVAPLPLTLTMVTNVSVSADVTLRRPFASETVMQVRLHRSSLGWNVPILSIKKPVCDWMTSRVFGPIVCPLVQRATGQSKCTCPVPAAHYKVDDVAVSFDLSKLPIPRLFYRLGAGSYQFELSFSEKESSRSVGCILIKARIKTNL